MPFSNQGISEIKKFELFSLYFSHVHSDGKQPILFIMISADGYPLNAFVMKPKPFRQTNPKVVNQAFVRNEI